MTEKFEKNIRDWYSRSRTSNLEYLDLAETKNPELSNLANNIGVVFDKVCLLSKVSLKHFYKISEENSQLKAEIVRLQVAVAKVEKEVYSQKPLTKAEVKQLVDEIAKQLRLVEEEALKITEDLKINVRKVECLLEEVKSLIGG